MPINRYLCIRFLYRVCVYLFNLFIYICYLILYIFYPMTIRLFNPISTLPEHLHSTSLSYAKTTWKHTNQKETLSFPLYRSLPVSRSPTPPYTPLHWETQPHPLILVILYFGAFEAGVLLGRSCFVTFNSPFWFQSYRCFISFDFINFSWITYLCDIVYIYIYIYIIRSAFYVFFSDIGGGGGGRTLFLVLCLPP